MPSSHSATVCALATATGIRYGGGSFEFALAAVFAIVVMYDAMGVRQETGKQGKVLNEELKRNLKETVRENVETARENVETVKESVKESLKDNVHVHVIYPEDDLMNAVDGMDEEQLAALKERIAAREQAKEAAEETEAKDEDEKDGSAE